ncbi:hypothetical protein V497_04855 [Pseudogymnoascus sp. VKM F-4516 (FW-969)]|nr:hypothetical protein V497_04855 [Pseudogymnoascus sp. VKM F-4516 (FW-969)]
MFSYTSGRYVYNEKKRLAERNVEFDIEALKLIAAESVGRQKVSRMKKLAEGGFNRVFLLIMGDGFEAIVKIPYHITVPKYFTTESEAATLDFLQSKGVPVPRVYAWSSKSDDAVGTEYIIMEKAPGNPALFDNPDPTPPKDFAAPSLPENYASLNPEETSYADELHRRRMLFYLYMIFNGKDNKDHFSAMRTLVLAQRQHLIERAGMEWTGNTVTLEGALRRVVDGWGLLALEGHGKVECPISFSVEESEAFFELEEKWFKGNILVEHWKKQLDGMSGDGWVRSEVFEGATEKNRQLKEWIEIRDDDEDRACVEGVWPFDDREEVE